MPTVGIKAAKPGSAGLTYLRREHRLCSIHRRRNLYRLPTVLHVQLRNPIDDRHQILCPSARGKRLTRLEARIHHLLDLIE